jgi:hypothetical protein
MLVNDIQLAIPVSGNFRLTFKDTRARQYQDGSDPGLSLRAGGESHLRRDGGALWHCDHPARPRKPRDCPKVESAVRVVVLAPLRDRPFFSLAEVNHELASGSSAQP